MKISKKVRDEAALICALVASNHDRVKLLATAAEWIGVNRDLPSCQLARAAFHCELVQCSTVTAQIYADAEALLRTGWSPGDEP